MYLWCSYNDHDNKMHSMVCYVWCYFVPKTVLLRNHVLYSLCEENLNFSKSRHTEESNKLKLYYMLFFKCFTPLKEYVLKI